MKMNYMILGVIALVIIGVGTTGALANRVVNWTFDETSGNVANDATGNGINGTLGAGFTAADWAPGQGRTGQPGDGALYLNGDPNCTVEALNVDLTGKPVNNIFAGTSSWTINLWIKYDGDFAKTTNIAGFGDCNYDGVAGAAGYSDRYFAYWAGGTLEFEYGDWGFWPGKQMPIDQWSMITLTYDGATKEGNMYVDGQRVAQKRNLTLVDTDENAFKINSGGMVVYSGGLDKQGVLKGWVDDFCVWDQALRPNQVAGMYARQFPCSGDMPGDINADCVVDVQDLQILASSWLNCNWVPQSLCP